MLNRNNFGDGVEGGPDKFVTWGTFDIPDEFVQLHVSKIQVAKVSIMNPHGLSSSTFEPGADGAGIMAMVCGGVGLTGATVEHLQRPSHIFKWLLEIRHGSHQT